MGFPKPWPTEWPEPDPTPDPPDPPVEVEPGEEPPVEMPEYRRFRSVTWAVNHACNLRCTHCYDAVPHRRSDLNTSEALEVVSRLSRAGVEFIAFSGGEAFLRKDLFLLMGRARELGLRVGARSNGTRITTEAAQRLRELSVSVVGVSFDGAMPETHDAVRGKGSFEASMNGLRALVRAGVRAQIEVVLSRANLHEAEAFIRLGEDVGASEVNFSALTPQGRGAARAADLLNSSLWSQVTAHLRALGRDAAVSVTPNCALLGPCCANIEPHVTCEGWVTPCYLSTIRLFSVLKTPPETFRDLLEASRANHQDVCGRRLWTRRSSHPVTLLTLTPLAR